MEDMNNISMQANDTSEQHKSIEKQDEHYTPVKFGSSQMTDN